MPNYCGRRKHSRKEENFGLNTQDALGFMKDAVKAAIFCSGVTKLRLRNVVVK
jgi:hypothetical protein